MTGHERSVVDYRTDTHRRARLRKEIDLLHPMEASQDILYDNLSRFPAQVELALLVPKFANLRSLCVHASLLQNLYVTGILRGTQKDPWLPIWLEAVLWAMPTLRGPFELDNVFSRLDSLRLTQVTFSALSMRLSSFQ
jgi:hypothetical protein